MTDLRRYARTPFETDVTFRTRDVQGQGRARDISLGGMFITTDEPLAFGATVTLRFIVPGERNPIEVPAVVRWTGESGMGVQFGSIGARETHYITELTRPPQ